MMMTTRVMICCQTLPDLPFKLKSIEGRETNVYSILKVHPNADHGIIDMAQVIVRETFKWNEVGPEDGSRIWKLSGPDYY